MSPRVLRTELLGDPQLLAQTLLNAKGIVDVAGVLEISARDLTYILYRAKDKYPYRTFQIPKKTGGEREINAPHPTVKILQQKLNGLFACLYDAPRGVHGYVQGRGIVSNARRHEGKNWVFNIDLVKFFPEINFGRVRGMLIKWYKIDHRAATVLAQICTHDNQLPQGAPTSPVLSNMICQNMDRQLHQLARQHGCWFTRYADDITFSSRGEEFPREIGEAVIGPSGTMVRAGHELAGIVAGNGFRINENKVWLRPRSRRQRVTGLTVNQSINVPRAFIQEIRIMIHACEAYGVDEAGEYWHRTKDGRRGFAGAEPANILNVIRGKIEHVAAVKGKDDAVYCGLMTRLAKVDGRLQ